MKLRMDPTSCGMGRATRIENDQTLQFAGRKLGICCMQAGLQEEASQNGGGEGNFKSPRRVSPRSYPKGTLPKIRSRQIHYSPLFTTIRLQIFQIRGRFGDCSAKAAICFPFSPFLAKSPQNLAPFSPFVTLNWFQPCFLWSLRTSSSQRTPEGPIISPLVLWSVGACTRDGLTTSYE